MTKSFFNILIFSLLIICISCNEGKGDDPFWAKMIKPKYRNAIYPTMEDPQIIKIRTKINLNEAVLSNSKIEIILERDEKLIKTWYFPKPLFEDVLDIHVHDISFQYTRSGPYITDDNQYLFTLKLMSINNDTIDIEKLELNKYPPPPAGVNEVRIDDNDNVLINGRPTFIYGAYTNRPVPQNYDSLKSFGFNAVRHSSQSYNELWFLVTAEFDDILLLQNWVLNHRELPQTLGWYLDDEPTSAGNLPADSLRLRYQIVRNMDPYHPAGWVDAIVSQSGRRLRDWTDYESCHDFIMIDSYPCDTRFTYLKNITRNFERIHDPSWGGVTFEYIDVPTWGVPQMFEWNSWRWPKPHEEKNMVYQYVTCGAKSLFPYKYGLGTNVPLWHYWRDTLLVELKSIESAIFASRKSGTSIQFPQNQVAVKTSDSDILVWSYRQGNEKEYLFLLNTSNKWNQPLGSTVPGPADKIISIEVTFNEEGNNILETLVSDPNMPQSYSLDNNKITLQLDGVNNNSTGVLVLSRDRYTQESKSPSKPNTPRLNH